MAGHRAGAASRRDRTPARPNWLKADTNKVKQARGRECHLGGRARGGLARSPASSMAGNAGAGLRRLLAAWAECERGRSCVK
jgi:hypothetical protein